MNTNLLLLALLLFPNIIFAAPKKDALGCSKDILKNGFSVACDCKVGMIYDAELGKCQVLYSDKVDCTKSIPPQCNCSESNYTYQKIEKKCLYLPWISKPLGICNEKMLPADCKCASGYKIDNLEYKDGTSKKYCFRNTASTIDEEELFAPEGSEDVLEDTKVAPSRSKSRQ